MTKLLEFETFTLLGKPLPYWIELNSKAEMMDWKMLMEEIVRLKMLVAYYEQVISRIDRMGISEVCDEEDQE